MKKLVVKKNGSVVAFDPMKIRVACESSAKRVGEHLSDENHTEILNAVMRGVGEKKKIPVDTLHHLVQTALQLVNPLAGNSYQNYRDYKETYCNSFEKLFQKSKDVLFFGDRENANFDSALISTKGSLIKGYTTSELYKRFYLSTEENKLINSGFIYAHDIRDLILGCFNCVLFDIGTVLKNGFVMSNIRYTEPKSVLSALQVIGDVTLVTTAQQFG